MDVRTDGGSQVKRATIARGPTETIAIMEGWRLCVWMGPMIGATTAPFQMPLSFIVRRCCPPALAARYQRACVVLYPLGRLIYTECWRGKTVPGFQSDFLI